MPLKDRVARKAYHDAYNREHYQRNKQLVFQRNKEYKLRIKEFLFQYLLQHPCVDCGERDPIVLEFDHVRGTKEFNLASAGPKGYGLEKIKAEIAKCDVRCCNCHRRATYLRSGRKHRTSIGM